MRRLSWPGTARPLGCSNERGTLCMTEACGAPEDLVTNSSAHLDVAARVDGQLLAHVVRAEDALGLPLLKLEAAGGSDATRSKYI